MRISLTVSGLGSTVFTVLETANTTIFLDENFGAHIRALRTETGLSLRGLARTVEMSPAFLSKIEAGDSTAAERKMRAIARALGQNEEEFLLRAGRVPAAWVEAMKQDPVCFCRLMHHAICADVPARRQLEAFVMDWAEAEGLKKTDSLLVAVNKLKRGCKKQPPSPGRTNRKREKGRAKSRA